MFLLTRGLSFGSRCRETTRKTPKTSPTRKSKMAAAVYDRSRVRSLSKANFFLFFLGSFPFPVFLLTRGIPFGSWCREATRKTPKTTPMHKSNMADPVVQEVPGSLPDEDISCFSFFLFLSMPNLCSMFQELPSVLGVVILSEKPPKLARRTNPRWRQHLPSTLLPLSVDGLQRPNHR